MNTLLKLAMCLSIASLAIAANPGRRCEAPPNPGANPNPTCGDTGDSRCAFNDDNADSTTQGFCEGTCFDCSSGHNLPPKVCIAVSDNAGPCDDREYSCGTTEETGECKYTGAGNDCTCEDRQGGTGGNDCHVDQC